MANHPPPRKFIASDGASQNGLRCSTISSIHSASKPNGRFFSRMAMSSPSATASATAVIPLISGQRRLILRAVRSSMLQR